MPYATPFSSFFLGGFEACQALNEHRQRLDLLGSTRHDVFCRDDYQLLRQLGITAVRESLAWHEIDRGHGHYDFSRFEAMMQTAREAEMQVIWSLNHFDYPNDADPFAADFPERYAAYAEAAVRTIRRYADTGLLYIIPINEPSFFSWLSADVGQWAPFALSRGFELKTQLARAVMLAIDRIRAFDADVRFIHVDPIMHRITAAEAPPEMHTYVANFHEAVFQTWDLLSGRLLPELGGRPDYLDFIGVNYYLWNQDEVLDWPEGVASPGAQPLIRPLAWDDPRRSGLDALLAEVYARYQRPMVITETGSYGAWRLPWWQRIWQEVNRALEAGLPVQGICAYPVIDMRDWHQNHLTNAGFWDFAEGDDNCERRPHAELLALIQAITQEITATALVESEAG